LQQTPEKPSGRTTGGVTSEGGGGGGDTGAAGAANDDGDSGSAFALRVGRGDDGSEEFHV
jgi:hypothetical protein